MTLHLSDAIPRDKDPLDREIDAVRNFLDGGDGK